MQIQLTGQHIAITEPLRSYVQDKLARIERHYDGIVSAHVVLSVAKLRQQAEATLQLAGNPIVATAVAEDMYAAIDALVDKIDRQLQKHKDKLSAKHRGERLRP